MPQLKLTEVAMQDYADLVGYLAEIGAVEQAITVGDLLDEGFDRISQLPNAGKMFDVSENIRECFIRYGKAGYSFLYTHDLASDTVTILTIKHYRQGSYHDF